eukprot:TRINITY_DN1847_c0_g1_i1.p1 TRINITY_DN1847_c0_g1~~TRINITY_DN1847_c0_g1_i1.p1  ORF type:complete len:427 (+),score=17.70 TRINITY_DN1847_c0_g1_i1:70-1350(+)
MNYNNRLRAEHFNTDPGYQHLIENKIDDLNEGYYNYIYQYSNDWINHEYLKTSNKPPLSKDCTNLSYSRGCYAKQDLFTVRPLKIKYARSDMFKPVSKIKEMISRANRTRPPCPIATQVVQELVECNIVRKAINPCHKIIINPIYFKQKKPGKISIIYDGINSNRIIKNYVDFEVPHVYHILNDLKQFRHPTRVDINNAYFNTPVSSKSKKLLGFAINNQVYYWNCLPFGIANAPNLFIKTTDEIVKKISEDYNGLMFRKYFDDIIIEKDDKHIWVNELKKYNISVKDEGDTKFLGFEYHSKSLRLPPDKLDYIQQCPKSNKATAYIAMAKKIEAINQGRYIKPLEVVHNWKYYLNPDFKRFVKYNYDCVSPYFIEYIYTLVCLFKQNVLPFAKFRHLVYLRDYLNIYKIKQMFAINNRFHHQHQY